MNSPNSFTDADITAYVYEGDQPDPDHPNLGRTSACRAHAVAVRALRILLLRGLLAGLPSRRFLRLRSYAQRERRMGKPAAPPTQAGTPSRDRPRW